MNAFSLFSRRDSSSAFGLILFSSVIVLSTSASPYGHVGRFARFVMKRLRDQVTESVDEGRTTDSVIDGSGTLITRKDLLFSSAWRATCSRTGGESAQSECELVVVNELCRPVCLCWVDAEGNLCGMRPVNDLSIRDSSVSNAHVEYTYAGHAFLCLETTSSARPQRLRDVPESSIVFIYRPERPQARHTLTLTAQLAKSWSLRSRSAEETKVVLHCEDFSAEDKGVVDTSSKIYHSREVCGFDVRFEPGVFEDVPSFYDCFLEDMTTLVRLLPRNACDKLRRSTPIFLNKSITYGKKSQPAIGRTCTFHPMGGAHWLKSNGLGIDKEGSVEVQCAEEYINSRRHWGAGGIFVHEFSHAFHNKFCINGYDNAEISQAFELAMSKKLYDAVCVHGPQGERDVQKAYACTNCMEFFAELSVAYHWHLDSSEYNKWYPFNREQLRNHDPESFAVIDRIWNQFEE